MRSWLKGVFRRQKVTLESKGVGDVYTFKTHPFTEFSEQNTNRYGAFKIVDVKDEVTPIVVLDTVGLGIPPTLDQILQSSVLIEKRFAFSEKPEPAAGNMFTTGYKEELLELKFLANIVPSAEEIAALSKWESYFGSGAISTMVEGEWRWANDRKKLEVEWELKEGADRKKRAAEEHRLQTRLKHLTWKQLASETQFSHWELPPADFVAEARQVAVSAIGKFAKIEGKPTRKVARQILLGLIEQFNALEVKYDGPIETEEREDIMMFVEEIAYVACQRSLVAEADAQRIC